MPVKVAIIDYGMGNLHSVYRKLFLVGGQPVVTSNSKEIQQADKIILPGVGHFAKAMSNIKSLGLLETLNNEVLIKEKPILGICLGMQLMAVSSEEGGAEGLGWINGEVKRFEVSNEIRYKVPQTGWNTVAVCRESHLFRNIPNRSEFYFLHAYHYHTFNKDYALAMTNYDYSFVSAIEKENILGTQFHPEKSHDAGMQLIKNFLAV